MSEKMDALTQEKIMKKLEGIYGIEKEKNFIASYFNYLELKAKNKLEYGNCNVKIDYRSNFENVCKLIDLICEMLNEKGIINGKYAFLEDDDFIADDKRKKNEENKKLLKDKVKSNMLVIDFDSTYISESKFKNITESYKDRIFVVVEKNRFYGSNSEYKNITWNFRIDEMTSDEKCKFINSTLNKNGIKVDKQCNLYSFMKKEAKNDEDNCSEKELNDYILQIIVFCKENNINRITNKVIKEQFTFIPDECKKKIITNKAKKSAMKELNNMVGVEAVKEQIEQIINFIKVNKYRNNLPALHMCFKGNPGTGKTSVARIIGKIFAEQKILSNKEIFVEIHGRDLVGKYVGWTASKTMSQIKRAEGGVLFIDEAYSLDSNEKGGFEDEAIDTLIKEMEDKRDKICIILAGYEKEMDKLIERNPGFQSRIPFHINFPDYNEEELYKIFSSMLKSHGYNMEPSCKQVLVEAFKNEKNKENFSNGRYARNILEKVEMAQADRASKEKDADINLVKKVDIEKVVNKITVGKSENRVPIGFHC